MGNEREAGANAAEKRRDVFFLRLIDFVASVPLFRFSLASLKRGKRKMLSLSRLSLSLSARLGGASSRAAFFATRTTACYGTSDDSPGPGGGGGGAAAQAHPASSLDKEREREEQRRHARGGKDPGIDEEKLGNDPGAESGPIGKSLHSAKGKMKEAVG